MKTLRDELNKATYDLTSHQVELIEWVVLELVEEAKTQMGDSSTQGLTELYHENLIRLIKGDEQ